MGRISHVLVLALNGLLLASAVPQYGPAAAGGGGGGGNYNQGGSPPPPPPPPSQQNYGGQGGNTGGNFGGSSSGGSSSGGSSSGGGGGDLSVQCKASPDGSGKIRYDCSGVNKDAITLKTEHFLWLENSQGANQNLDIEIPNYNIDEFIKAAYKALGPQEGAKINIQLKKPDVTYNAEKSEPPASQANAPAVSVNYQPVDKISVHYPTQKQYSNGGGSSSSSSSASAGGSQGNSGGNFGGNSGGSQGGSQGGNAGGNYGGSQGGPAPGGAGPGAYSRPQRESGYRYYFVRQ